MRIKNLNTSVEKRRFFHLCFVNTKQHNTNNDRITYRTMQIRQRGTSVVFNWLSSSRTFVFRLWISAFGLLLLPNETPTHLYLRGEWPHKRPPSAEATSWAQCAKHQHTSNYQIVILSEIPLYKLQVLQLCNHSSRPHYESCPFFHLSLCLSCKRNLSHSQHHPLTDLQHAGWWSSPFLRPWAGSKCKHNSAIWVAGHTSPIYCHYIPGDKAGTKLYCLMTEAHVCEQLAQGR